MHYENLFLVNFNVNNNKGRLVLNCTFLKSDTYNQILSFYIYMILFNEPPLRKKPSRLKNLLKFKWTNVND